MGKKERRELLGYSTKGILFVDRVALKGRVCSLKKGFVQMNHTNDFRPVLHRTILSFQMVWCWGLAISDSQMPDWTRLTRKDSHADPGRICTSVQPGQGCLNNAPSLERCVQREVEISWLMLLIRKKTKKHPSISRMCHLSSVPLCGCHEQVGKPVWFPCLYICHLNLFLGPIEQIMARHVDVRTTMPCSNPCYNAGHENFRLKGPWTFCKRPLLAVLRAEALKFHTKSISKQPYNCPENTWCSLWKVLRGWCHSICSLFAATKTGGSASKIIKLLEG